MDSSYDVKKDELFVIYRESHGLTDNSADKYAFELNKFCKANDLTLSDFINECKRQQSYEKKTPISTDDDGVEEYYVEKFDVNSQNSLINKGINKYISLCLERGNSNTNINNSVLIIRSVMHDNSVVLPSWKPKEDDIKDWNLLHKEDFIFILNDCSLNHKALITFMLSSGMRLSDCLNWTIGDFMDATSDFHDFIDVNDFIDNAPNDMIGFWNFKPQKTIKHKIPCKTCNSIESSNYILQNLRRVKNEYLPKKSLEMGKELKLSKKDYLFGSRHKLYKGQITVKGISDQFTRKNKKLREWKINQIKIDIKEGKLSEEDFDKAVSEIPRFHAHGCRKYFQTVVNKKSGNLRLCALMEGHRMPLKNDPNYIKVSDNDIKEIYLNSMLECLTLENVEVKTITTEEGERLKKMVKDSEDKIAELIADNEEKDELISTLQNRVDSSSEDIQKLLDKLDGSPKIEHLDKGGVDIELHSEIRSYIRELIMGEFNLEHYGEEYPFDIKVDGEDELVITELSYDIIVNNPNSYDGSKESLDKVITKAKAKLKLNPEYRDKVEAEYALLDKQVTTLERISKVIMKKVEELNLFDNDKELELFFNDVVDYVAKNTFSYMGRFLEENEIIEIINKIIG